MTSLIIFIGILVVIFIGIVIIKSDKNKTSPTPKKPTRRYVKDVQPGEYIIVEWSRILEKMGAMKCINNDPQTKKILLEIRWGNYKELKRTNEYEKVIFDYEDVELKNFHLLNQLPLPSHPKEQEKDSKEDFDIATLQKQMNEALSKEDYETAEKLQKKIDKLLKK